MHPCSTPSTVIHTLSDEHLLCQRFPFFFSSLCLAFINIGWSGFFGGCRAVGGVFARRFLGRRRHWQLSSSITLIFHNNMKNTVHCRGLMNCIFRVTLAFLMKVDEFPWAGQLCLSWCWLCQGASTSTTLGEGGGAQIFHPLINLPLVCQIILGKTYDSKCDIYHNQTPGPRLLPSSVPPLFFEMNMFVVGGINSETLPDICL